MRASLPNHFIIFKFVIYGVNLLIYLGLLAYLGLFKFWICVVWSYVLPRLVILGLGCFLVVSLLVGMVLLLAVSWVRITRVAFLYL